MVKVAAEKAKTELHGHWLSITVLHVRKDLLGWYERLGFVDTGRREAFHPNPHEKCLVPDLHFAFLQKEL